MHKFQAIARLTVLCLATSALVSASSIASAAITNYPNGSNNSGSIVLFDNNTILLVNGGSFGSATQSGVISGAHSLTIIGEGPLSFTATNTYSGGTVIGGTSLEGHLQVNADTGLGAATGGLTFTSPSNSLGSSLVISNTFNLSSARTISVSS